MIEETVSNCRFVAKVPSLSILSRMTFSIANRLFRPVSTALLASCVLSSAVFPAAAQQRVLGIDVSAWQGDLSRATWNNLHNVNARDFVFIRSSRGGTTGFFNQNDPNNNNNLNTLSQRYDDPYFAQNITRATSAGILAGPYHFARPDIIASTQNAGGIANTGADEADHFIEMAGAWMRPGYLLPVYDFEAGQSQRSSNQLAQFSIDFSDRIYEVTGIRPAIYTGGNYANTLQNASPSLQDAVVAAFPNLWLAYWPNQSNPESIPVQTAHPNDSLSYLYGPWDDAPQPAQPWGFWQYASTGRLSGYKNGNSNIDVNVAQGGIEFLKDHLVPALWTTDSDGQWASLSNWNSGQAPIAPVQGSGQVPRVGSLNLPAERLPGLNDTVILDRPGADISITLDSGTHNIRKLEVHEELNLLGGVLTVNYIPSPDSSPISARFSAPVVLDGGIFSFHTLQVDATQAFSIHGNLVFNTLQLMPHPAEPATLQVTGDVNFSPLNHEEASIVNGTGSGSSGFIDLGGQNRTWYVADGGAEIDLRVEVPIANGSLAKTGEGTLALVGSSIYSGDTIVQAGTLSLGDSLLEDTSDVYLEAGATIDLDFSGSPDMIDSLFLDGISLAAGTWGAVGSGAQFSSPHITGTGLLEISTFVTSLAGDFDADHDVDAADFLKWQRGESPAALSPTDLADWETNLGLIEPLVAASTAVPEPSTGIGLLIGFNILLFSRRHYDLNLAFLDDLTDSKGTAVREI